MPNSRRRCFYHHANKLEEVSPFFERMIESCIDYSESTKHNPIRFNVPHFPNNKNITLTIIEASGATEGQAWSSSPKKRWIVVVVVETGPERVRHRLAIICCQSRIDYPSPPLFFRGNAPFFVVVPFRFCWQSFVFRFFPVQRCSTYGLG